MPKELKHTVFMGTALPRASLCIFKCKEKGSFQLFAIEMTLADIFREHAWLTVYNIMGNSQQIN